MARLIVSPQAAADVDDIIAYLAAEAGSPIAVRYGAKFRDAFRHLVLFPETGAQRSRLGAGIRIWVVSPYLVFYRFARHHDEIRILRVLHGRRNVLASMVRGDILKNE